MKKEFNITGNCYPNLHYMMNNQQKFDEIMELIHFGKYFTINRPRQFGKTTMLFQLMHYLEQAEEYLPIKLNFQGVDSSWHESDGMFAKMFVNEIEEHFAFTSLEHIVDFIQIEQKRIVDMDSLSSFITRLMYKLDKKVVLLIDEVDASSNYMAFLSFLAMLRKKFLSRQEAKHRTFHSIVLAGVHDIKSLKFKLRNPDDIQVNSPWNIAIDFEVRMEFDPEEIAPMLEQYCEAEGVTMDIPAIAERLYYHTSGYPFLVSKLCKNVAEKVLKHREDKSKWTLEDVEESVQLILKENNTNFDSLIKNLENHDKLYNLVYNVLMNGVVVPFNPDEPMTRLGRTYGIFKQNGRLKIHNRIYEQRIYNYMTARRFQEVLYNGERTIGDNFTTDSGELDMESVLRKFQAFMKEQRSEKDVKFIERQWRLIFLAFLKPILNGRGHDFKEVETSEEKRLDVVVTYMHYKYILELKLWKGPKAHGKGLNQLADYLDIHGVEKGYLLIFDTRKKMTWEVRRIQHKGKEVFAVWL